MKKKKLLCESGSEVTFCIAYKLWVKENSQSSMSANVVMKIKNREIIFVIGIF